MIAHFDIRNRRADRYHFAGSLMPQNARIHGKWIFTVENMNIGTADSRSLDPNDRFVRRRRSRCRSFNNG